MHKGQTNKTHQVKLQSSIQQVYWSRKIAYAGSSTQLNVLTHHIGNNSEIKISITDNSGKSIYKKKSKISGNYLGIQIPLPKDCSEFISAEADLPKHGLNKKSDMLAVYPPVEIKNLKWEKTEVNRNDVIKLSAEINNIYEGTEVELEIYEYSKKSVHELVTKFSVPVKKNKIDMNWEFDYHDKTENIPSANECEDGYTIPSFFFRVRAGDTYADSEKMKFFDWIEIQFMDGDGNPFKEAKYVVEWPDGNKDDGKLDPDGYLKKDNIPPGGPKVLYSDYKYKKASYAK